MANQLFRGDCLDILPTFPAGAFDLVIMDPPYMVNMGSSEKSSKASPWADLCNGSLFYRTVFKHLLDILPQHGAVWTFSSWKSFSAVQKAALDCNANILSVLIWDKGYPGAGMRGPRSTYELVALIAKPDFAIKDRSLRDIKSVQWHATKSTGHPAEKPVPLLSWLIDISRPRCICDPFMGSGSTGVACALAGVDFVGIELSDEWFDFAAARIKKMALYMQTGALQCSGG
jgi:DNA modification methylase